jgi:hypothetical protein
VSPARRADIENPPMKFVWILLTLLPGVDRFPWPSNGVEVNRNPFETEAECWDQAQKNADFELDHPDWKRGAYTCVKSVISH